MKANPESVADIAARVSATSPIPSPATKKSLAVRVRRVGQARAPRGPGADRRHDGEVEDGDGDDGGLRQPRHLAGLQDGERHETSAGTGAARCGADASAGGAGRSDRAAARTRARSSSLSVISSKVS